MTMIAITRMMSSTKISVFASSMLKSSDNVMLSDPRPNNRIVPIRNI